MPLRALDDLDDAVFDVTDVQVVDGRVCLRGQVDEPVAGVGRARRAVTVTVVAAVTVTVDDATGTGDLVLERIDVGETHVTLTGVVPCTVVIATASRSEVLLDVADAPFAVRRWGRWRPWPGGDAATAEERVVRWRLRTNACPFCTHPWAEHPDAGPDAGAHCGECEYEVEHGEAPEGRGLCSRVVPAAVSTAPPGWEAERRSSGQARRGR
jgi:hypothetical protein